jgi:hypothetical protein
MENLKSDFVAQSNRLLINKNNITYVRVDPKTNKVEMNFVGAQHNLTWSFESSEKSVEFVAELKKLLE